MSPPISSQIPPAHNPHAPLDEESEMLREIRDAGSIYAAAVYILGEPIKRTTFALAEVASDVELFTQIETQFNDLTSQLRAHQDGKIIKNHEAFDELIANVTMELVKKIQDPLTTAEQKKEFSSALSTVKKVWGAISKKSELSREDAQGLANALLSAKELIIPPGYNTESLGIQATFFRDQYNTQVQQLKDAIRSIVPQV